MTESKLNQEYGQLKADIDKLRGDVSGLVMALRELGVEKLAELRSGLDEELAGRQQSAAAAVQRAKNAGVGVASELEAEIVRRPLAAVLLAAGLGFVVGSLLTRDRD